MCAAHRRLPPHRSRLLRHDNHRPRRRLLRLDLLRRELGRQSRACVTFWDLRDDYGGFLVDYHSFLDLWEEVEDCYEWISA